MDKQKLIKLSDNHIWQVESGTACLWNEFQRELTVWTIQRLTLESWSLNRCQQVPVPYKWLVQDENETDKQTFNRPIWLTIGGSKPTNDQ